MGLMLFASGALGVISDPCMSCLNWWSWLRFEISCKIKFSSFLQHSHLFISYVNWLVKDDPYSRLPTTYRQNRKIFSPSKIHNCGIKFYLDVLLSLNETENWVEKIVVRKFVFFCVTFISHVLVSIWQEIFSAEV